MLRASSYLGGDADAFLRPPVGAYAAAMGGAATAGAMNPIGWWNPAALDAQQGPVFSSGCGLRSLGRPEGYVSYYFGIPPRMSAGACMVYRGDPRIELRDSDEKVQDHGAYTTVTSKISLGYMFSRHLSLGMNIGLLYQSLPSEISVTTSTFTVGAFDLAMQHEITDAFFAAFVIRHLNTVLNWQMKQANAGALQSARDVGMPPEITAAISWRTAVGGRTVQWHSDCNIHVFDHEFALRERPALVWNNGVSWAVWEQWHLRFGIGDMTFDSDLYTRSSNWIDHFAIRAGAGFLYIPAHENRPRISYSLSNSKSLSGVNQQLEIMYTF